MFGPDIRRRRASGFIAIAMRGDTGRRVITKVRVNVDDARRNEFSGAIDDGVARCIEPAAHRLYLAIAKQDGGVIKLAARSIKHCCTNQSGGCSGIGAIGGGVRNIWRCRQRGQDRRCAADTAGFFGCGGGAGGQRQGCACGES